MLVYFLFSIKSCCSVIRDIGLIPEKILGSVLTFLIFLTHSKVYSFFLLNI
jgi:hypothetical protein